jgi:hypothetical protein
MSDTALQSAWEKFKTTATDNFTSFVAGWLACKDASRNEIKAEPLARVIAEGQYEFPRIEWLSADHSLRHTPMYLLYCLPDELTDSQHNPHEAGKEK